MTKKQKQDIRKSLNKIIEELQKEKSHKGINNIDFFRGYIESANKSLDFIIPED